MSTIEPDDTKFGEAEQVDTNPGGDEPAELLGICFGDLVPNLPCVLIGLQVRLVADGEVSEGERPPIMIDYSTLRGLHENLPKLLDHMEREGAAADRLDPPASRMPAWNGGPRYRGPMDLRGFCAGFGFFERTIPEKGAAMAYIELTDAARGNETTGGSYLVSHRVLLELQQHLPKVLRKMEQKGHAKLPFLH